MPEFSELMSGPDADKIEQFSVAVAREARTLQEQLDSGVISTTQQFEMAVMGSAMRIAAEYPELQELFEDLQ